MVSSAETLQKDDMVLRYKQAVEKAIARLPAKNGVVDIDSIWVETSLPYDLLQEILTRDDLVLPEHVERINIKSRVRAGEQLGEPQRTRGRRRNKVRD